MSKSGKVIPSPDRALLSTIKSPIIEALPDFLRGQRWFADKHRQIDSIDLADVSFQRLDGSALLLAIADVRFADGHRTTYFIPLLVVATNRQTSARVCTVRVSGANVDIIDAVPEPAFHRWLLQSIRADLNVFAENGRIACRSEGDLKIPSSDLSGRLAGVEQSNSSILFGDLLIAKVYRRLSLGTNPDLEVGRYLNALPDTNISPALAGSAEYQHAADSATLVTLQEQLRDPVDCWTFILSSLGQGDLRAAALGRRLGTATAQLHVALASGPESPAFSARPATERDVRSWKSAFRAALDTVSRQLADHLVRFDAETRTLAEAFNTALPGLQRHAAGFDTLTGSLLIRVHGDYHLGQVLRLPDGQLRIVDFEGEPQRPIHERRAKTSPLKDVAGMLRSFSYAAGSAATASGHHYQRTMNDWESDQRQQFIEAYREAIQDSGTRLMPDNEADLNAAIASWQVDKALYEVLYELSSRPEWLWLPLSSLVEMA